MINSVFISAKSRRYDPLVQSSDGKVIIPVLVFCLISVLCLSREDKEVACVSEMDSVYVEYGM